MSDIDTRGLSPSSAPDDQQIASPKEAFPPISDAPLDEISSPQAAVAAATRSPVTTAEPGGNTVVWLPPSQYDAIKDKWQDQFIWQPTAFANDLPVNQTSFIGVNRSRENSAAAHPGVVAGRVPAARTLGDISEGPSKVDEDKRKINSGEDLQSDDKEQEENGQNQATSGTSHTTNTRGSRPSPEAPKEKIAQRRPVKTKQWHSFHLLKDPDPDQNTDQDQSTSRYETDKVINVPNLPHQEMKQSKQTNKGKNVGRIPVLVPEPRDDTNGQNNTSSGDTDRRGKQHHSTSRINDSDAGPISHTSGRHRSHRQNPSFASSTTPTLVAAEEAVQQAVQEQQDENPDADDPANAIIVAEMPDKSNQRPRQPLILPTMPPNPASTSASSPYDTTGDDSLPSRSSTRRRRGRKKASTVQTPESIPWTPPQSSSSSYSHSPAPSMASGNYASSSTAVSRRPTRRSASQRPSVFEESILFQDVDNHRRAMQLARTSTPPQQSSGMAMSSANNSRGNNNTQATRRERKSASPTLNTQNAPVQKQDAGFRVELQLNLEIEVQLKAKIHGDLTLSLFE